MVQSGIEMTKPRLAELPRAVGLRGRCSATAVYAAVFSVGVLMVVLILSAPLLVASGYPIAGAIVYQAFVPLCHQLSDRSFHVAGLPLAVCARCTGVYGGFAVGLLIYPVWRDLDNDQMPGRVWLLPALMPMAIDALAGTLGLVQNTPLSRAATGVLAGAAMSFYIVPGLVSIIRSGTARGSRRSSV